MKRYAVIQSKNCREIVLLQGLGCRYKQCHFCDYYLDVSPQRESINQSALDCVNGMYGTLEVINSGSFGELSKETMQKILEIAKRTALKTLIFECHYQYRSEIKALKEFFSGFHIRVKLGLESFDEDLREKVMRKGIKEKNPQKIAQDFDEANFLIGIKGQTIEGIQRDLELGLLYFDRICVNVLCDNSKIQADSWVISQFMQDIYPLYQGNDRIDVLLNNTDFGVG